MPIRSGTTESHLFCPFYEVIALRIYQAAHCDTNLLAPREALTDGHVLQTLAILLRLSFLLLLWRWLPARVLLPPSTVLREERLNN